MTVGEMIKSQRIACGLSLDDLSERLGVAKGKIEKWECGYVDDMSLSKIISIAKLFKIKPSKLIEEDVVDFHY